MTPTAPGASESLDLSFDVVDLIHRTGSHRRVAREVIADDSVHEGSRAMTVPTGNIITLDAHLESVVEGIFVSGTVQATLTGECSRCLDPVEQHVTARIDELFSYPERNGKRDEDTTYIEDDTVHLGPLAHDALAVEADDRPLCSQDCLGLCSQCGVRMDEDPEHSHEIIDPRWAALEGLMNDEGTQ